MKTRYKIILTAIASLHWIFYGLWMLVVIINPEIWFFGEKFSGYLAIAIHLVIGVLGMLIGYLIYKKNKFAYFGGIFLFAVVLSSILVNHFSCEKFDLYCN